MHHFPIFLFIFCILLIQFLRWVEFYVSKIISLKVSSKHSQWYSSILYSNFCLRTFSVAMDVKWTFLRNSFCFFSFIRCWRNVEKWWWKKIHDMRWKEGRTQFKMHGNRSTIMNVSESKRTCFIHIDWSSH